MPRVSILPAAALLTPHAGIRFTSSKTGTRCPPPRLSGQGIQAVGRCGGTIVPPHRVRGTVSIGAAVRRAPMAALEAEAEQTACVVGIGKPLLEDMVAGGEAAPLCFAKFVGVQRHDVLHLFVSGDEGREEI